MATKKQNATSKQDIRLKNDIASFKASVAFLLFCVVVFFTVNNLQYTRESLHIKLKVFLGHNPWLVAISAILLILGFVYRYMTLKSKKDESYSYFSSEDTLGVAIFQFLFIIAFLLSDSLAVLLSVIVGYAVVYYVKHFFGKDFLYVTLLNCCCAMALWLVFGHTGVSGLLATCAKIFFVAASGLGFIATVYGLVRLYLNKSYMKAQKLSILPAIVTLAFAGVLGILLLMPNAALTILVAEIILLAQYLGLGIYYTVRLLNQ